MAVRNEPENDKTVMMITTMMTMTITTIMTMNDNDDDKKDNGKS